MTRESNVARSLLALCLLSVWVACERLPQEGAHPAVPAPRRILFISLDTVRADALDDLSSGAYPNLAAISEEGALFERFYAASTYTIPSHMAMLTGLDPVALGALASRPALPADAETLASRLADAGYATMGFHEGGYVASAFGFDNGFADYEALPRVSLVGDELPRVLEWIQDHGDERYFLFLHTYAAHAPYGGYETYREESPERGLPESEAVLALDQVLRREKALRTPSTLFDLMLYNQLCEERMARAMSAPFIFPSDYPETPAFEADMGVIRRNYAKRIELIDRAIGEIRAQLERDGLWRDTLLVLTSDHGEAFFEHGLHWHGFIPYDEVLRVPLVLSYPRLFEQVAPGVRDALAWHLDLYPTILRLAGLEVEADRTGQDLTAVLEGPGVSEDRAVFPVVLPLPFEERRPPRRVALRGTKKLVEAHADFGLVSDALYDVVEDPDEAQDRATDLPKSVGALRAALAAYRASVARAPRSPRGPRDVDAKTRAQLEALGYAK